MDTQTPETVENAPTSRRALIASLIGAGAAVMAAGRASAADAPTDSTPATTTTAPPNRSAADAEVLNSLIALENDMIATYAAAKAKTAGDDLAALTLIEEHHVAYVQAIEGNLGRAAISKPGTARAVAGANYGELAVGLAQLEGEAVAAHVSALATVQGIDAAELIASIITIEARHGAALLVSAAGTANAVAGI